ncbi:MAG: hypothetical protein WB777_14105 [Mycobacterium sp.]
MIALGIGAAFLVGAVVSRGLARLEDYFAQRRADRRWEKFVREHMAMSVDWSKR